MSEGIAPGGRPAAVTSLARTAAVVSLVTVLLAAPVLAGAAPVAPGPGSAAADRDPATTATLTVDDDGGADFATIQAAIDAASAGDTVEVRPGTYAEELTVGGGTNVTVVAPDGATLDGSPADVDTALEVRGATRVVLDGFTVRDYEAGVVAAPNLVDGGAGEFVVRNVVFRNVTADAVRSDRGGADWVVRNVRILDSGTGEEAALDASGSGGAWTVEDVRIVGGGRGIDATESSGAFVVRDVVVRDTDGWAFSAAGSTGDWVIEGLTVVNSTETAGGLGVSTVRARDAGGDWTVRDATVRDSTGAAIDASGATGAWTVENATLVGNGGAGVRAFSTGGDWTVRESTVRDNGGRGIDARRTDGAWTVTASTITGNGGAGVDATDAAVEGDATGNWWGQSGGPTDDQCVGNVDCSNALDSPPGDGDGGDGGLARFDANDDGRIGLNEVLAAISAFNTGSRVGGQPVDLNDVLGVISAFNTGQSV